MRQGFTAYTDDHPETFFLSLTTRQKISNETPKNKYKPKTFKNAPQINLNMTYSCQIIHVIL